MDTVVDLCRRRLPERMGIPADQIQVLSPTRRRGTGTGALNQALQAALNPPAEQKGERRFGDWIFRAGDRVMQVKNNYDILWREEGGASASGMGMFNGDIGVIRSVDKEGVLVDFDGKVVEYSPDMLGELEPAFAVTVHKAQGSEYRAVILAALDGAPMLMTRGVLYTAITREARRYSGLRARLAGELGGGRRRRPSKKPSVTLPKGNSLQEAAVPKERQPHFLQNRRRTAQSGSPYSSRAWRRNSASLSSRAWRPAVSSRWWVNSWATVAKISSFHPSSSSSGSRAAKEP